MLSVLTLILGITSSVMASENTENPEKRQQQTVTLNMELDQLQPTNQLNRQPTNLTTGFDANQLVALKDILKDDTNVQQYLQKRTKIFGFTYLCSETCGTAFSILGKFAGIALSSSSLYFSDQTTRLWIGYAGIGTTALVYAFDAWKIYSKNAILENASIWKALYSNNKTPVANNNNV